MLTYASQALEATEDKAADNAADYGQDLWAKVNAAAAAIPGDDVAVTPEVEGLFADLEQILSEARAKLLAIDGKLEFHGRNFL